MTAPRLRVVALCVAAMAALLPLDPVGAVPLPVYVVDDDGLASATNCNATTPAAASTVAGGVAAAVSSSIVKVCPGTYVEATVELPAAKPGLLLRGARAGTDGRRRIAFEAGATVLNGQFTVRGVDQTIDGFTITGGAFGINMLNDADNITIIGNVVIDATGNGLQGTLDDSALPFQDYGKVVIRRNRFESNGWNGVALVDAGRATITENVFRGNGLKGIDIYSASHVTIERNQSFDGEFVSVYGSCVAGQTMNGLTVTANKVKGGGILVDRESPCTDPQAVVGVTFSTNVIDDAPGHGIEVATGGVGLTISRNTVRDSGGSGVYLSSEAGGIRVDANNLARSGTFDCDDDSTGGGTAGTNNTWTRNHGRTSSPTGLCR